MEETIKFYEWFKRLGGDCDKMDVAIIHDKINAKKENRRNNNLKQYNHVRINK